MQVGVFKRVQRKNSEVESPENLPPSPSKLREPRKALRDTFLKTRNALRISKVFAAAHDSDGSPDSPNLWDSRKESRIAYLLKKARKSRKDTEAIYEHIKDFPAFTSFVETKLTEVEDEAIYQMCKHMFYEKIPAGTWIMRQGDISNDKFYIVLSGSVSIILNNKNIYTEENMQEMMKQEEEKEKQEEAEIAKQRIGLMNSKKLHQEAQNDLAHGSPQLGARHLPLSGFAKPSVHSNFSRITLKKVDEEEEDKSTTDKVLDGILKAKQKDVKKDSKSLVQEDPENEDMRKKLAEMNAGTRVQDMIKHYHIINKILKEGESFGEKALTNPDARRGASILTNTDCEFIILYKDDFLKISNRFSLQNKKKIDFLKANVPDLDQVSSRAMFEDFMYSIQQVDLIKGNIVTEEGVSGEKIYLLAEGQCTVHKTIEDPRPEELKLMYKQSFTSIQVNEIGPGTMIGEELIFSPEKCYKYTVKVHSFHARLYYLKAPELKIKFPKRTISGLKSNFEVKEEYRNQRIEYFKRENFKKLDFQSENMGFELKQVLKMLQKPVRFKMVSNKIMKQQEDAQQEAQDELIDSSDLYAMKKEVLVQSRNSYNIQYESKHSTQQTIDEYYVELEKYRRKMGSDAIKTPRMRAQSALLTTKNFSIPTTQQENLVTKASSRMIKDLSAQSFLIKPIQTQDSFFELTSSQQKFSGFMPLGSTGRRLNTDTSTERRADNPILERTEIGTFSPRSNAENVKAQPRRADTSPTSRPHLIIDGFNFPTSKFQRSSSPVLRTLQSKDSLLLSPGEGERPSYGTLNERLSTDPGPRHSSHRRKQIEKDISLREIEKVDVENHEPALPSQPSQSITKRRSESSIDEYFVRNKLLQQKHIVPPNKRNFVIRQKVRSVSEEQVAKNEEALYEKLHQEKIKRDMESSLGLGKFNFCSNRYSERQAEAKKKILMFKFSGEFDAAKHASKMENTPYRSPSKTPVLNLLRAATPGKDHLYRNLESDFLVLERSFERRNSSQGKQRAKSHESGFRRYQSQSDHAIDIKSDEKPNVSRVTEFENRASTAEIKVVTSNLDLKQLINQFVKSKLKSRGNSRNLHVSNQLSIASKDSKETAASVQESKEGKDIVLKKNAALDRQIDIAVRGDVKKGGAKHSLRLKKDMREALDAKRKILAWRENFGGNLSLEHNGGTPSKDEVRGRFELKSTKVRPNRGLNAMFERSFA